MKKIAYLLDSFPRVSETFIINEILEMKNLGFDINIFSRSRISDAFCHDSASELAQSTYYCPHIDSVTIWKLIAYHLFFLTIRPVSYIQTLIFALKLRKKAMLWFFKMSVIYALPIHRRQVDHIHSHFVWNACVYAMLSAKILDIPFTFTAHGWHDIHEFPPEDFCDRAMASKKVITISEFNRRLIHEKFQVPLHHIEIVHCGINPDYFKRKKDDTGENNVILTVARLHAVKGLNILINACRKLDEKGLNFQCLIIGDGEEKDHLQTMIDDYGLKGKVVLEGGKRHKEIVKYYQNASVFVLTSYYEGIPVVLMEAMGMELPVVSSKITGVPELVLDNETGYLVEVGDVKGFAEAVYMLLSNPDLRRNMGKKGRVKVLRDFNLKHEAQKLADIWLG